MGQVKWRIPGLPKAKVGQSLLGQFSQGNQSQDWFKPLANSPQLQQLFRGQGATYGQNGQNPYGGLIGGSPDLSALESEYGAQSRSDAAARDAALRRLVISYGGLPSLDALGMSDASRGFLKNALDAHTLELARKAEEEGVSVHARQAKDDAVTRRRIPATLAGRGMLRSGQTVSDLSDQAQNYKNLQYDTLNELLGNVENTTGGFLRAEQERAIALAQAKIAAAWQAMQNWGDSSIDGGIYTNDSGLVRGPWQQNPGRGTVRGTIAAPPSRVRGYFGNTRQTKTALNNRLRSGRM